MSYDWEDDKNPGEVWLCRACGAGCILRLIELDENGRWKTERLSSFGEPADDKEGCGVQCFYLTEPPIEDLIKL